MIMLNFNYSRVISNAINIQIINKLVNVLQEINSSIFIYGCENEIPT